MILSAKVNSSPGENLTPACLMGDGGVFNVMFSLGASSWSSIYLPKQSLFT